MKKILLVLFILIFCFATHVITKDRDYCRAAEQITLTEHGTITTWETSIEATTICVFDPPLPANSVEIAYDDGCRADWGYMVQNQNWTPGAFYQGLRVRFTAPPEATGKILEARVSDVVHFGEGMAKIVLYNGDGVAQGFVEKALVEDGNNFQVIDVSSIGFVPGTGNDFYIAFEPGGDICLDGLNAMGAGDDDTSPDGRSEIRSGNCSNPFTPLLDVDHLIRAVVAKEAANPCRIYFDIYHGVLEGYERYSGFISHFSADIMNEPITEAALAGYDIIALFAPTIPFTASEVIAINSFVSNGGRAVLLGEWGPGFDDINGILENITLPVGIDFNSDTIYDPTNNHDGLAFWPILHLFSASPITEGLQQVLIPAGSSLTLSVQAEGLIFGDDDTYTAYSIVPLGYGVKTDGTGSEMEMASIYQAFDIIAAARAPLGNGDIIVIGDSNILDNSFSLYDNLRLAENIFFDCAEECIASCSEDESGTLNIVETSGVSGNQVTVTVEINSAPNVIDAMGFEVVYNPNCLEYVGYTRGDCVVNWSFVDVTNPAPGVLRFGGFTTVDPVLAGESCDVVKLTFLITTPELDDPQEAVKLDLQALVDDISGWSTSPGYICGGCSCDVSGNGTITPQDALCAFQKYLGICPTACGPCDAICCDVKRDGNCTPADALCIFQEYLGIGCAYCGGVGEESNVNHSPAGITPWIATRST